jgi:hypothetical protein
LCIVQTQTGQSLTRMLLIFRSTRLILSFGESLVEFLRLHGVIKGKTVISGKSTKYDIHYFLYVLDSTLEYSNTGTR